MTQPTLLLMALLSALVAALAGRDHVIEAQIERNLGRVDEALLHSPDLTVVVCGTGSPLPDRERASACTAVVAGGALYLVDAGPGSFEVVDLANDILGFHTSPVEAAEAAKAADVPRLVLTHLVPAPANVFARREFLAGVSEVYDGEVTLGRDGLVMPLPARH